MTKTAVSCPYCGREHPHERALRKHLRRVHEKDLPLGCDWCERRFETRRALESHKGWAHHQYVNGRNDPLRQRDWNLRTKYGIGIKDYEELLRAQGSRCAVCAEPHGTTRATTLHVDHDHRTGQVRGLLCANCNHVLGKVRDDVERLLALALYLERHRG